MKETALANTEKRGPLDKFCFVNIEFWPGMEFPNYKREVRLSVLEMTFRKEMRLYSLHASKGFMLRASQGRSRLWEKVVW